MAGKQTYFRKPHTKWEIVSFEKKEKHDENRHKTTGQKNEEKKCMCEEKQ